MVDKYSEEQLLSELKSGSERAFDIIYKMYAKRLFLFCFQYCKRKEDAEEIVLDVFLWLWRNNHKIKQGESLRYLIYLRARHFLINAFRTRVNSPIYTDYIEYENRVSVENTNHQLEYQDFEEKIVSALKHLPKTQQEVIRMSKFEGMKIKEISIKLELSEQTVKNQISVGLKTLKTKLGIPKTILLFWFLC